MLLTQSIVENSLARTIFADKSPVKNEGYSLTDIWIELLRRKVHQRVIEIFMRALLNVVEQFCFVLLSFNSIVGSACCSDNLEETGHVKPNKLYLSDPGNFNFSLNLETH